MGSTAGPTGSEEEENEFRRLEKEVDDELKRIESEMEDSLKRADDSANKIRGMEKKCRHATGVKVGKVTKMGENPVPFTDSGWGNPWDDPMDDIAATGEYDIFIWVGHGGFGKTAGGEKWGGYDEAAKKGRGVFILLGCSSKEEADKLTNARCVIFAEGCPMDIRQNQMLRELGTCIANNPGCTWTQAKDCANARMGNTAPLLSAQGKHCDDLARDFR